MTHSGITSYGVYLPTRRLSRSAIAEAHAWSIPALKSQAKGERTFCDWDEDTLTMGVEAARGCLRASKTPGSLTFVSTTPVFADLQNASFLAAAAGLPGELRSRDTGGSLRAATSALIDALESRDDEETLIVAADNRTAKPGSVQEMQYGAGSVALGVGRGDDVIARHLGSASQTEAFVDHFRAQGVQYDYAWEERWIRDEGYLTLVPPVIQRALKAANVEPAQVAFFCLSAPLRGAAAAVAKRVGLRAESVVDDLSLQCGDIGTPQPFLLLAAALEQAHPGDKLVVVGFGGGCDAVVLEVTDKLTGYQSAAPLATALASGRSESHYTKLLSFQGLLELDFGMRAEVDNKTSLTQLARSRDQVLGFTGGVCESCQQVQFPRLAACVNCGNTQPLTPYRLTDEPAKVATWTDDRLQYYPSPPLRLGLVDFDCGARVLMEMVNVDPDNFDVGTRLRMVFRIKQKDARRGFHRYFWKATPLT